ncbi:unnamed protein product, partial [Rotaria magnacalcarata]
DVPKAKQSKTEQYSNPMLEQNETREKKEQSELLWEINML